MRPEKELTHAKKEIGKRLLTLRNQGGASDSTLELTKDKLSLALRLHAKLLRENPSLRRPKQMNLFTRN